LITGPCMRILRTVLYVAALVCAATVEPFAQETSDAAAVSKILALESVWDRAVETGDTRALDAIFDNFLVYVEHDGRVMGKAEYLAGVKRGDENPLQVSTEGMRAHIWGTTAIVTGIYRERGVRDGKPYDRRGRFIDTWIFKNGTWVCVAAQATPMQP